MPDWSNDSGAKANLRALPLETLHEIWAEWTSSGQSPGSLKGRAEPAIQYASTIKYLQQTEHYGNGQHGALVGAIWRDAAHKKRCSDDGMAHLCPCGCEKHRVSFDNEEVAQFQWHPHREIMADIENAS